MNNNSTHLSIHDFRDDTWLIEGTLDPYRAFTTLTHHLHEELSGEPETLGATIGYLLTETMLFPHTGWYFDANRHLRLDTSSAPDQPRLTGIAIARKANIDQLHDMWYKDANVEIRPLFPLTGGPLPVCTIHTF